jgi:hypothetical protein
MLTRQQLEVAHCWEADDRVPRQPAMTEFRRRIRYHQAEWREANGHPVGSQPIVPRPGKPARLVGSRVPLPYGRETGANFLTAGALDAARSRSARTEARQSFDHQRLWADLLSSLAMAFNLFGDMSVDLDLAGATMHALCPDAPGTVRAVRFAHSPGWLDPTYLNNLRAFDVAFELDLHDGTRGIVAMDTKYHEPVKRETPRPDNLDRYQEVSERSAVFAPGGIDARNPSDLAEMWLEHLLMLSMLQHPSGRWTWGRYVIVHPVANTSVGDACTRYRNLLADDASFGVVTVEEVLDAAALAAPLLAKLRRRYIPS